MIRFNNHRSARDDPMDQTASLVEVHLGDLRWEDHQTGANRVAVVVADTALVVAADFRNEPA